MNSSIFFSDASSFDDIKRVYKPAYHEFRYEGLKCICTQDILKKHWRGYIELSGDIIKIDRKYNDLNSARENIQDIIDQLKLKISILTA